jgi:hypothetical protein
MDGSRCLDVRVSGLQRPHVDPAVVDDRRLLEVRDQY